MAPRVKKEDILIINRRTGKALQCAGMENGDLVEQVEATGSDAQLWTPVSTGRSFKLRNKLSGKVLDIVNGGTEAGSWAQIWEDVTDGHSQVWEWVRVTATYRKLMNVQSGKVLDIVDMREDDGAPAQIWDDVDGVGQQWKLVEPIKAAPTQEAPKKRSTRKAKEAAEPAASPEEAPKKRPSRKTKAAAEASAPAQVEETPKAEPMPAKEEAPKAEDSTSKLHPGRKTKAAEKPAAKRRGRKSKEQA